MSALHAPDLDTSSRSDLVARAEALGIANADVLTRAELVDEIVKRTVADPIERRLARGLLGVARDLVARVVERGLHLPDAAALIRGLQQVTLTPVTPPIATVTLAEIYAGQGHRARALAVLDEVLEKEPEHAAARALRNKVAALPDTAPTMAPSEPPPDVADTAARADHGPDSDRDRDRDRDHDRDADHDRGPESHVNGEIDDPEGERDTLPPAADNSPTLAPTDLPLTTWRVAPPDELPADAARSTEVAPPLERPDADQLRLVPVDATSALARWELREGTLDEARARAQGGELILRIVAVTPSWDGPVTEIRDVEVTLPIGDWWVCDLPPDAVLRAALGWRDDRGFDPLAVALDVAALLEDDERASPVPRQPSSSWRLLALAPWEAPFEAPHQASFETH